MSAEPFPYVRARGASGRNGDRRGPILAAHSVSDDATLGGAVAHSLAAAKGVLEDRLALMRIEWQRAVIRLAGGGVMLAVGVAVLAAGWFALAVGAVLAMGVWWGATLSLPIRLVIVMLATTALGGGILAGGLSRLHDRTGATARDEREPAAAQAPYTERGVRPA